MKFIYVNDPLEPDRYGQWVNVEAISSVRPEYSCAMDKPTVLTGSVINTIDGHVIFTPLKPDKVMAIIKEGEA